MTAVVRFFRAQIDEIARDDVLRWYGVAMAFLHVVTYLYWTSQRVAGFLHAGAEAICWPLVPECEALRVLSNTVKRLRPPARPQTPRRRQLH